MRNISFTLGFVLLLLLVCGAAGWLAMPVRASQKIAVTEDARGFSADTGAGLVYTIRKANGDMVSCQFHGTELNSQVKHSQIGMGLGKAEVSCRLASSGTVVILTAVTDTLTHYYISRAGENTIYMATYIKAEPAVGELRYIFRGNGKVLTQVPAPSNNGGSTGLVEHTEIHRHADGTTSSKYYGNTAAKDLTLGGDTGDGVGVFMAYGSREKSSGGPFYRDIQFQSGGNADFAVGTFDVGSPAGDFPALQFRQVNSPLRIRFSLTAAQAAQTHRLKIGITVAYNGGRPAVLVNGRELPKLPPSVQPKSRSLTVGTYRGNNHTFVWEIPAADFVAGENELVITPLSGNQDLDPWLSAAWAYDCLELDE